MVLDKEFPPDPRVENEALILLEGGYEVFILCYAYSDTLPVTEVYRGIRIRRIKISKALVDRIRVFQHPSFNLYKQYWEFKVTKFAENNRLNALHVHDLYMIPSAIKARRLLRIPLIVDLHENYPAALKGYAWANTIPGRLIIKPQGWDKVENNYLRQVDRIIVLSEYYQQQLLNRYNFLRNSTVTVYPNVPKVEDLLSYTIRPVLNKKGSFIVLYFGAIGRRRGVFTVLDALAILVRQGRYEIKILIIGPIDKKEQKVFFQYLSNASIKNQVIYYPWKDISEIPSYISESNVCLSPILKNDQHESGIANKVFQYMLFARPVIVSDCGPQKNLIESTGCGLVHESDNAADLATKITYLQDNPELCAMMGERGRQAVIDIYNTNRQGQQLIELYRTIR